MSGHRSVLWHGDVIDRQPSGVRHPSGIGTWQTDKMNPFQNCIPRILAKRGFNKKNVCLFLRLTSHIDCLPVPWLMHQPTGSWDSLTALITTNDGKSQSTHRTIFGTVDMAHRHHSVNMNINRSSTWIYIKSVGSFLVCQANTNWTVKTESCAVYAVLMFVSTKCTRTWAGCVGERKQWLSCALRCGRVIKLTDKTIID